MLGQKKSNGLKKAGELEILEAEEKRKLKRKQKENIQETVVAVEQHH